MRHFGELIGISSGSAVYETLMLSGDRQYAWNSEDVDRYWLSLILFALLDDAEFNTIVLIARHLDAGGAKVAFQLLTEVRRKRLGLDLPASLRDWF